MPPTPGKAASRHGFDVSALPKDHRTTGIWAAGLLRALAREEASGRRTQRLTEPGLSTWKRFRGLVLPQNLDTWFYAA